MPSTAGDSVLADIEASISLVMPTALDVIATVVEAPAGDLTTYDRLLGVAEANPPTLFLALVRCAAGLAAIAEMDGTQVRALAA